MAVYNPVLFDRYYTDNNIADQILSNSEATTTALLQTYLDAFSDYIESDKSSLYTDGNDSDNSDNKLLFEHLFDQALGDAYTASLDNQLTKLNGYLFLLDPNHPVDTNYTTGVDDDDIIDTQGELADRLENTAGTLTTEQQHYENDLLLDMKLFSDVSVISSLFSEGEDHIYDQLQFTSNINHSSLAGLFDADFATNHANNTFITYSDYLSSSTGFVNTDTTPFGGITYYEGREFIDSIWNQPNHVGIQELLITLYRHKDTTDPDPDSYSKRHIWRNYRGCWHWYAWCARSSLTDDPAAYSSFLPPTTTIPPYFMQEYFNTEA